MNEVLITIALSLSICVNVIFAMLYFQPKSAAQPSISASSGPEVSGSDVSPTRQSEQQASELASTHLRYGRVCHYASPVSGPLEGKLVFIADDIPDNIEVLVEMLGQLGLSRYVLAKNGKEAVALFYTHAFDIAYMDIQMPVMNGLDATENIKAIPEHSQTPIIPITAHSRVVTQDLCKQCGFTGFLQKPVMLDKLRQATQNAIGHERV